MLRLYLVLALSVLAGAQWSFVGEISVENAGFTNVYEHENPSSPTKRYSLLLASFNPIPFTEDNLFMFRYIGESLSDLDATRPIVLSNRLTWPREPSQIPSDVFGYEAVSQPDGFLVPGKNEGAVKVIDIRNISATVTHDISNDPNVDGKDWFYHRVTWKDMNGDGLRDAFICRARRDPLTGVTDTEMVWFRHPDVQDKFSSPWALTVMNQGLCDTFSVPATLTATGRSYNVIFTVGYFSKKLVVHWTMDPNDRWDDLSMVQSRVIAEGYKFFDVRVADLNMDGQMDLLVSLNAEVNGSLVAYEIPSDFRTGTYIRHELAAGFSERSGMIGAGSPGMAKPFYPKADETDGKPWIAMSGDDDGRAYILRPEVEDWQYTKLTLYDAGEDNIVGALTTFDSDGDGFSEIFVPSYYEDKILVYTFNVDKSFS